MKAPIDTPPAVRHLTVDEESDGQRLDNFLVRVLKGVPKTHINRIIRSMRPAAEDGRIVSFGQLDNLPKPNTEVNSSATRS